MNNNKFNQFILERKKEICEEGLFILIICAWLGVFDWLVK